MEKILVVEDDQEIRTGIKYLLNNEGFEVAEASDGSSALDVLNEGSFDLIISDIMMPGTDGYELLTNIQRNEALATIPFLFLTAKTSYDDFRKGMNLGVDDYLTKPFKASELINAVNIRLKKKNEINSKFEKLKLGITKYIPHELRTPLVSIIGFSDLILKEYQEEMPNDIIEMVEKINVAGNRLQRTIEKFLIFTEIKSNIKFAPSNADQTVYNTFPIPELIDSISSRLSKIYHNEVKLMQKVEECNVKMTERHFNIMMTELIDNALKFSDDHEKVKITANRIDKYYKIEISNKGKEFPQEQINKISDFIQFDRDEFQQNGNGLGLQIVKSVLQLYNGKLEIKSQNKLTKIIVKILL